jgi:hypothetical protein
VQGGGTVTPTDLLDALPKLEIISVFGVGYDGVPVDYCRQRGIKVTNTPDVLTDDVADVAVGLVLMTGRGFAKAERFTRAGEWERKGFELTTKLGGKKVGILGLGRIGKAIGQRLEAMGMQIAYTGRKAQPGVHYRFVPDLKALAAESDFLIVACPGGPATKNLVDAGVLAALGKKGHDRQHRARLDHRRAGAGPRARERHDQGGGPRRLRRRAARSQGAAVDGERRAAAARRQRDARDAQGDGRSLQGQPRRLVRPASRC